MVKSPRVLTETTLHETALAYIMLAETLETVGTELLIHNEAADIAAHFGTKTAFEHLLDLCMGKVSAQVDVGWVYYAGEDPEALLWRNAGRVKSLHFKDFASDRDGLREVSVGAGAVEAGGVVVDLHLVEHVDVGLASEFGRGHVA